MKEGLEKIDKAFNNKKKNEIFQMDVEEIDDTPSMQI
jgi:hypothetical protein